MDTEQVVQEGAQEDVVPEVAQEVVVESAQEDVQGGSRIVNRQNEPVSQTSRPYGDDRTPILTPKEDFFTWARRMANVPKVSQIVALYSRESGMVAHHKSDRLLYVYPNDYMASKDYYSNVCIRGTLILQLPKIQLYNQNIYVKLSPSSYIPKKMVRILDMDKRFASEVYFYRTMVNTLQFFQDRYFDPKVAEEHPTLLFRNQVPTCFATKSAQKHERTNPDNCGMIILEEIMSNRNIVHVKSMAYYDVKTLAVFHATPYAIKVMDPVQFCHIMSGLLQPHDYNGKLNEWYSDAVHLSSIKEFISTCPEFTSEQKSEISFAIEYSSACLHKSDPYPDSSRHWKSLIHGKYWIYHLGRKIDVNSHPSRILDFQHIQEGHILSDLVFYIFTSVDRNLRVLNIGSLIHRYYLTFKIILYSYGITWENKTKRPNKRPQEQPDAENQEAAEGSSSDCTAILITVDEHEHKRVKAEFKKVVRRELIKILHQLKYTVPVENQAVHMGRLSAWPAYSIDQVENRYCVESYHTKIKHLFQDLFELGFLSKDPIVRKQHITQPFRRRRSPRPRTPETIIEMAEDDFNFSSDESDQADIEVRRRMSSGSRPLCLSQPPLVMQEYHANMEEWEYIVYDNQQPSTSMTVPREFVESQSNTAIEKECEQLVPLLERQLTTSSPPDVETVTEEPPSAEEASGDVAAASSTKTDEEDDVQK